MKKFFARASDRKWMLLIWTLFWLLVFITTRRALQNGGLTIFLTLICLCSYICVLCIDGMGEKDFLRLAVLIGVFFVVIAPFACLADEEYHFARAFHLSGGHPFPVRQNGVLGMELPTGYAAYSVRGGWCLLNVWQDKALWLAGTEAREFIPRALSASYLPLDYAFSAVGIGIGRLLRLPLLFVVLLGRLCNYAAYVAVAYLAIKRAKYYRSLFFLVATLPCCFYAGAVIHIDAPLIAFSLLYVSISLDYCLDETKTRVSAQDIALLAVSAAFILSTKFFGYCLLLPLILFAGKRKLANFRTAVLTLISVTLLVAAWQIWALLALPGSLDTSEAVSAFSARGQLDWILANKGQFATLLVRDFLKNMFERLYSLSFSEAPAFSFLSLPLRFLPFIAAARAKDKYPLQLKQRRVFNAYWLLAAAVMMLVCNFSLYVTWTRVGADYIGGTQVRYVLPYLIVILLALSTLSPVNEMKNWERRIGFLAGLALINMVVGTLKQFL